MKAKLSPVLTKRHRYPTAGDWRFTPKGELLVHVSAELTDDYQFLIGVHELVEGWLCRRGGVSEQAVTDFDVAYEKKRKPGDDSEPGDDCRAPYRRQHFIATNVERMLALEMGVDWKRYENCMNRLIEQEWNPTNATNVRWVTAPQPSFGPLALKRRRHQLVNGKWKRVKP